MTQDVPYDVADIRQYTISLLKETCPDMDPMQMSLTVDRLLGQASEEFERRAKIREKKAKQRNLDPKLAVSKQVYEAFCKVKPPVRRTRNVFDLVDNNVKLQSDMDDVAIHNKTAHPRLSPTQGEPKWAALPHFPHDESSRDGPNLPPAVPEYQPCQNSEVLSDSGRYSENSSDGYPSNGFKFNNFKGKKFNNGGYSSNEGKGYPHNDFNEFPPNGSNGFHRYRRGNNARFGKRGRPNNFNKNNHQNMPVNGNDFQQIPFQPHAPIPKRKRFA